MNELEVAWLSVVSSIPTILIAAFVAYIAYQQWRVNRLSLKEELFERRFEVFKDVQSVLSRILAEAKADLNDVHKLADAGQRAKFLFGQEIADYIFEVRGRMLQMHSCVSRYEGLPRGDERSKVIEKKMNT